MSFLLFSVLYFLATFGLGMILPVYLLRIKAPYAKFWFNILPILPAVAVSSWLSRAYWSSYAGWLQLAFSFLVMGAVLIANVAVICMGYRLIYKQKPAFE